MFNSENYQELCRLCASYQAIKMEIFGSEGKERNLVEKIEVCLPFKVSENDLLPKSICYRCMYLLENFHDFRKKCVHSVSLLQSCIRNTSSRELDPEIKEELQRVKQELFHGIKNNNLLESPELLPPKLEPQFPSLNISHIKSSSEMSRYPSPVPVLPMPRLENECIDLSNGGDPEDDIYEDDMESDIADIASDCREDSGTYSSKPSNEQLYTCKVCDKVFYSLGRLNLHQRIHNEGSPSSIVLPRLSSNRGAPPQMGVPRPFSCDLCDKSYTLSKHLWGHVNTCHKGDPAVTCPVCSRVSSTCANLEEHKRTKHGIDDSDTLHNQASDSVDMKPLPNLIDLSTKRLLKDSKAVTSTPINDSLILKSKSSSDRPHLVDGIKYTCTTCTSVFKSELELKKHLFSSQCMTYKKLDKKNVISETSLLKQTLLKSKPDSFDLDTRKRTLSEIDSDTEDTELDLRANKKLILEPKISPHDGNSGSRRKNSRPRKIARSKSGEGNVYEDEYGTAYACEVCMEVFANETLLAEHMTIHGTFDETAENDSSVEKPFTCLLCDKKFSVRQALSRHFHACHGIDPSEVLDVFTPQKSKDNTSIETCRRSVDQDVKSEDLTLDEFPSDGRDSKHFHSCEVCIRDFNDRSSLWLHMLYAHKEQAAYACGICLKVCSNNAHLKSHWKEHPCTEQRRYLCQICGRQHDSRKKLVSHIGIHSLDDGEGGYYDPDMLVLQNMGSSSDTKENFGFSSGNNNEFKFISGQDGYCEGFSCELCFKSFPSEEGLIKHKKNSHKQDSSNNSLFRSSYQLFFVCELCGSSHQTKSDRWRHVFREHSNEAVLSCDRDTCKKVFTTRALRHEHCSNHHQLQGAYPNTCEVCGKLWGSRVDFWKHMMGVHPDMVSLTCGVCLKVLCDVPELAEHVRTNHYPLKGGDFACDICGRSYSNHSKMLRHRTIHDSTYESFSKMNFNFKAIDAKFKASLGKSLSKSSKSSGAGTSADLNIPVVPQKDPLACDSCPDLKFTELSELVLHKRNLHCLFPCDLCTKCYGRSTHLWSHVNRKHKDHPDLTCPICSKLCGSKNGVVTHIAKLHTPKEPKVKEIKQPSTAYTCTICSKTFNKRTVYRKHYKTCRNKTLTKKVKGGEINLQCELCTDVVLKNKIEIVDHIREAHPGHPDYTCSVEHCSRILRCKRDLDEHVKMHKSWKHVPTCDICGETYDAKTKLWKHLYLFHTRQNLMGLCGVCFKNMPSEAKLIEHVDNLHPGAYNKPNACRVCAKTYSSNYKAWQHINKCHTYKACRECLHVFPDINELTYHLKEHHDKDDDDDEIDNGEEVEDSKTSDKLDDMPESDAHDTAAEDVEDSKMLSTSLQTDEANMSESRTSETEEEHDAITKRPKRSYECEICKQRFPVPSLLAEHKKNVHSTPASELKSYHCEICNKYFIYRASYLKHFNSPVHKMSLASSGISLKSIEVISSSFDEQKFQNENSSYGAVSEITDVGDSQHENSESKSSYFEGDHSVSDMSFNDCGARSSRRKSDVRRVYAEEEIGGPCYCTLCGKEWSAMRHLWQHLIRNHRINAAVTCGVCLEVCSDYNELSVHLTKQHPNNFLGDGNNFTCRICGRYHNARSKLLQHVTIHIVLGPEPENQPPTMTDNKNVNSSNFCSSCKLIFVTKDALQNHVCKSEDINQSHNRIEDLSQSHNRIEDESITDAKNEEADNTNVINRNESFEEIHLDSSCVNDLSKKNSSINHFKSENINENEIKHGSKISKRKHKTAQRHSVNEDCEDFPRMPRKILYSTSDSMSSFNENEYPSPKTVSPPESPMPGFFSGVLNKSLTNMDD